MLESALDSTRFLIVAAGRTGSTRLRLLLDSHPQAKCHGELFGENLSTLAELNTSLYRQIVEERELNPAKFLIDRVFTTTGHKAVGFKILYYQLTDQWPGLLDEIVADPTIRIVHLIRRNGLKRFLSEFVVGTVTHKNVYLPEDCLPMINPIHLPPASLWQNLCSIESQTENIRRLFCNHPFHEVIYEESRDDNGPEIHDLLYFLGLPILPLQVATKKILPEQIRHIIANYDEIADLLTGSRFEFMLESS